MQAFALCPSFAPIAQVVEQLPFKEWVVGSNPTGRTDFSGSLGLACASPNLDSNSGAIPSQQARSRAGGQSEPNW